MSDFRQLRVGDHIALLSGFPFSSDYFDQQEGTRLIRIRDLMDSEGETYYHGAFDSKWLVRPHDILIGMDGDFNIVRWKGGEALLNQRILKADAKQNGLIEQDFFFYWFGPLLLQIHNRTAATTVKHLSIKDVENTKGLFPNKSAQRRIAEILSTLDEAIEQTEALIAKHQQIKAGLMHDLFTRGVTPDGHLRPTREQAPDLYKESPLGWIPKEWDVCPIESLLDRIIDYRGKTPTKTIEGIPLITAKNVRMGYIDPEPREFIAERDYPTWMTRGIPANTDVVFTTEAPLGNVAQIGTSEKVAFAQRVIILQPGALVCSDFLRLLLMAEPFQRSVFRLSSGTTALGVKQSEFRKVMVAYPVLREEQQFISDKLQALEAYEAMEASRMQKLRQQKHGLMHDLLTGRVRVPLDTSAPEATHV